MLRHFLKYSFNIHEFAKEVTIYKNGLFGKGKDDRLHMKHFYRIIVNPMSHGETLQHVGFLSEDFKPKRRLPPVRFKRSNEECCNEWMVPKWVQKQNKVNRRFLTLQSQFCLTSPLMFSLFSESHSIFSPISKFLNWMVCSSTLNKLQFSVIVSLIKKKKHY